MAIINRRNAVLGWTVWQIAKTYAKQKTGGARPGRVGAVATILAAIVGAIVVWRLRADGEQTA